VYLIGLVFFLDRFGTPHFSLSFASLAPGRFLTLYSDNFGIEEEPPKFKGTMELPKETAAASTRISRIYTD
jgi:hypothetical protein